MVHPKMKILFTTILIKGCIHKMLLEFQREIVLQPNPVRFLLRKERKESSKCPQSMSLNIYLYLNINCCSARSEPRLRSHLYMIGENFQLLLSGFLLVRVLTDRVCRCEQSRIPLHI